MEIDITFSCSCGAFFDEIINCAGPSLSGENNEESRRQYWENLICEGCGKEYEVCTDCTFAGTEVSVPDTIDLNYDVRHFAEDLDIFAEIGNTQQLEIYTKVSADVVLLLRHNQPVGVEATLNNMLYAQIVTAVEAYLSSSFISTVVNNESLIRRLVESDPELAKRQFSLKEIFSKWAELKIIVARYLKDLIFHDIKKIKPMYLAVLEIDFGDVAWLFKAVLIRHDCVHRNGFDKDGVQLPIERQEILDLIKMSTRLVSEIEQSLLTRKDANALFRLLN